MTSQLPQKAQPIFISAFAEALHGKIVGIPQSDVNQILTGYSVLYRRLQRALSRFLVTLDEYESHRVSEGWNKSSSKGATGLLDDFLDCVYVTAELYELYESDIVKLLDPPAQLRSSYRKALAPLKREAVLLCNRCKHNHGFLQAVEVLYDNGLRATGFALYQMSGQSAEVNVDVHKAREAFSFNWATRRLLSSLLIADLEAAALVNELPARQGEPLLSLSFTLPLVNEVHAIIARPEVAMPFEARAPRLLPSEDYQFDLDREAGPVVRYGPGKLIVYLDVISQSLSLTVPYGEGKVAVSMGHKGAPGHPIPGYTRVVLADMPVED